MLIVPLTVRTRGTASSFADRKVMKTMGDYICAGINCGVLLIRNTDWAREFFADVGQYAYIHPDTIEKHVRPVRCHNPHPVCNY